MILDSFIQGQSISLNQSLPPSLPSSLHLFPSVSLSIFECFAFDHEPTE